MLLWEQWKPVFDDKMPIYRQITLLFSRAFVRGDIQPGDRIPSIREMSSYLKVNTNTMQRSYQEMERDGLLNSKRGTGFFLTEDLSMKEKIGRKLALETLGRFMEEMRALGYADRVILSELKLFMTQGGQNESGS